MNTPVAPLRLCIHGARGRMGARIEHLARLDPRFTVVCAVDRDDQHRAQSLKSGSIDAIIDFSSDDGARRAADLAPRIGAALLVGTTALSEPTRAALEHASGSIALIIAPNTSLGVAVLNHLAALAARLLGPAYAVELVESHHVMKKDAPSGTALRLAASVNDARPNALDPARIRSIREGDIVGEHRLEFVGPDDRLGLWHAATTRDLFARGALHAAHWLAPQPPGMYTIEQTLGLK